MRRVLVVAAHPDDDVLGCGGTIARLASQGAAISVVFLADGVGSRDEQPEGELDRRAAADRALDRLGVSGGTFAPFPDNALDTVPLLELCKAVSAFVADFSPDTVLTHSLSDLNIDHRLAAEATLVACRPEPQSPVDRVLHFEVPSATGWRPGGELFDPRYFVDISEQADAKLAALREYDVEMRAWPHARSYEAIDALMRWRGASVGVAAAEAFEIGLWRERGGAA